MFYEALLPHDSLFFFKNGQQKTVAVSLQLTVDQWLQLYSHFIVDEVQDHAVVDGDQVRWLLLYNLRQRLQIDEGAARGQFSIIGLGDGPTLRAFEADRAVLVRQFLELNWDVHLRAPAQLECLIVTGFNDQLLQEFVLVLVRDLVSP